MVSYLNDSDTGVAGVLCDGVCNIRGRTGDGFSRNLLCLIGLLEYSLCYDHVGLYLCSSPESHKSCFLKHVWVVSLQLESVARRGGAGQGDVGGVEWIKWRIPGIESCRISQRCYHDTTLGLVLVLCSV